MGTATGVEIGVAAGPVILPFGVGAVLLFVVGTAMGAVNGVLFDVGILIGACVGVLDGTLVGDWVVGALVGTLVGTVVMLCCALTDTTIIDTT